MHFAGVHWIFDERTQVNHLHAAVASDGHLASNSKFENATLESIFSAQGEGIEWLGMQ
jgi:hypothetical protein